MKTEQIKELIIRRRRQVLVHSIIYYRFNSNIISDAQYDQWSRELAELHKKYPNISKQADLYKEFEEWHNADGGSGFMLPLDNPCYIGIAEMLLRHNQKLTNKI